MCFVLDLVCFGSCVLRGGGFGFVNGGRGRCAFVFGYFEYDLLFDGFYAALRVEYLLSGVLCFDCFLNGSCGVRVTYFVGFCGLLGFIMLR